MSDEANVDEPATGDGEQREEPAAADLASCALCARDVASASTYIVNSQVACEACVAKVQAELDAQQPRGVSVAIAAASGLAGALVGAAVWAGVAIATDLEVGYIAVLVGFLAGLGVKFGAGKQRGALLQYLAAALSIVGLLAAKYLLFSYTVVALIHEQGEDIGYFDERIVSYFPDALGEMLGAFDVLFLVLALGAAYRVPKAHAVSITKA